MDDKGRSTWRLRLPFLEVRIEREEEPATIPEAEAPRRSSMADWYAFTPALGIFAAAAMVYEREWFLVLLFAALTAFGLWLTFRELGDASLQAKAVWFLVDASVLLVAGLLWAILDAAIDGTWLPFLPIVLGVFAAPYVASKVSPVGVRF